MIAVAAAGLLPSPSADAQAQVLRSDAEVNPTSFQYAYETSNGISGQESGDNLISNHSCIIRNKTYPLWKKSLVE